MNSVAHTSQFRLVLKSRKVGFLLAITMLCLCGKSLVADMVYNNGAPYRPAPPALATGYEMSSLGLPPLGITAVFEADDFVLFTPTRIDGVVFYDLESGSGFAGSVTWQIYSNNSDSPGTLLYSGTANVTSHFSTGFIAGNYSEFMNTFALPSVSLPAGTYWLALHNGPSTNSSGHVYWEKADGSGVRPSQAEFDTLFPGEWFTNSSPPLAPTAELLFQLSGTPAPQVKSIARNGGHPQISFATVANESYRVEYTSSLSSPSWTPVPGAEQIQGTGGTVPVTDLSQNLSSVRARFYRVVLL